MGDGRVVGMGLATMDLLGVVPRLPEKNTKTVLARAAYGGGGTAATAVAAAAALGAPTAFIGKVGDDDFGRAIVDGLRALGVDTRGVVVAPGHRSPFSFVAVDAGDASRTVFHAPGDAPPLAPDEVDGACLDGAAVLLVDGRQPRAQLAAVARARAAGAHVLLDAEAARDETLALAARSTVLIASERFLAEVAPGRDALREPAAALAALARLGAGTVVITLGERGSVGSDGGAPVHVPAFPVVPCVDTTGCGDVYHGAFAAALARGEALARCMAFASAAAALKCRGLGGRAALPRLDEVVALLGGARVP